MSDKSGKPSLDWMYEGNSSSVNHEDYLTGRKIGRDFERTNSDFQEGPSKLDAVIKNKTLTSKRGSAPVGTSTLLDLETIKTEDPLVAIKVRQEKMRQDILENPVKMKRLQKIVMKSMEEKMKKMIGKRRRSGDSSSSSDDSSSSNGSDEKYVRGRRSPSPARRKESRRYEPRRSEHPNRSSPKSHRNRDRSPRNRDRSHRDRDESHRDQDRSHERRRSPVSKKKRNSTSSESSVSSGKEEPQPGYGLIHFKKPSDSKSSTTPRRTCPKREEEKKTTFTPFQKKKSTWKPMSEEEMERRRQEMMDNAKWRDDQRKTNLKRYARDDEEQEKRDSKQAGESVDFIRKMMASSAEKNTVEGNVKSKIQRLQRSSGAMDTNFARK